MTYGNIKQNVPALNGWLSAPEGVETHAGTYIYAHTFTYEFNRTRTFINTFANSQKHAHTRRRTRTFAIGKSNSRRSHKKTTARDKNVRNSEFNKITTLQRGKTPARKQRNNETTTTTILRLKPHGATERRKTTRTKRTKCLQLSNAMWIHAMSTAQKGHSLDNTELFIELGKMSTASSVGTLAEYSVFASW